MFASALLPPNRHVKVVLLLGAVHEDLAEHVPGVEVVHRGDALESPPAAGGRIGVDLALGQHRVVHELPLVPGGVPPQGDLVIVCPAPLGVLRTVPPVLRVRETIT